MSAVVEAGAALDALVHQFSDPLSFYRELVQNALDAGSRRVAVAIAHEGGDLVVRVDDWGEGMTSHIIDTQLTCLFSSRKAGDATRIGKFGIGFVSVFATDPDTVLVETARSGEAWSVLFRRDRTFVRTRLAEAREGTRVTLRKATPPEELASFLERSRATLKFWCRHVEGEVSLNGEVLNEPFDLPEVPCRVRHAEKGLTIVAGFAPQATTGFYNRGLTLLESRDAHTFPGLALKISAEKLEHTLTRDNVVCDDDYVKVMRAARELIDGPLTDRLLARMKEDALYPAATRHYGWSFRRTYPAAELSHRSGAAEGSAWAAVAGEHYAGHIIFGPYATDVPPGPVQVDFRVSVEPEVGESRVVTLEVYDAKKGRILNSRSLDVSDLGPAPRDIRLTFRSKPGQTLEFRTFWHGTVTFRQDHVRVLAGSRRAREKDEKRLQSVLFETPQGGPVTLGGVLSAKRLLLSEADTPLTRALAQEGVLVVRSDPGVAELLEVLLDRVPQRAEEAYVLPEPADESWEPLRAALYQLTKKEVRLVRLGASCPWPAIAAARLDRPVELRGRESFWSPRRLLAVNADHPSVTLLLALGKKEPELAAYLLAKLYLLQEGLELERDSALAWRAWELRCQR